MKVKRTKTLNLVLSLISLAFIVAVWAITAEAMGKEYILPTLSNTIKSLIQLFGQLKFYYALLGTVLRTLIAFISSYTLAFVLAVLSVKSKCFSRLASPIIAVLRALPTVAVVLLLLVWTSSKIAPIIVTALVILPTAYSHLKSAFESLDKSVIEAGRVDGADELRVLKHVELPLIVPTALVEAGSCFSLNFKLMVAAEVLSATSRSLGNLMNLASVTSEMSQLLALVIVSVVMGIIIEGVFNLIANKICDWK